MGATRRLRPLTAEVLTGLQDTAGCDHWRADLTSGRRRAAPTDRFEVVGWAAHVFAEWGHCGMVAEHDGRVVGYLALAPAHLVPAVGPYATSPVGADAAVLLAVHVMAGWTRRGIGRQLVQGVAADLSRRDVSALEAVGSLLEAPYTLPEGWLDAVGFRLVRDHPLTPRYRLDLSSTVRWRPDFSAAWHRVRDLVAHPAPPEPARFDPVPRLGGVEAARTDLGAELRPHRVKRSAGLSTGV